jgi:O-antigen/teichoic acid export membrane protein
VLSAILNLSLNLVLVPMFGVYGAAYATLASALIGAGLWLGLSQRHYPIGFTALNIALFGWAFTLCLLTATWLQDYSIAAKGIAFLPLALLLCIPFRSLFSSFSHSMRKSRLEYEGPKRIQPVASAQPCTIDSGPSIRRQ